MQCTSINTQAELPHVGGQTVSECANGCYRGTADTSALNRLEDPPAARRRHTGPTPEQAPEEGEVLVADRKADLVNRLVRRREFAQAHSPVCKTVCRPVPVVIERVRRRAEHEAVKTRAAGRPFLAESHLIICAR